MDTRLEKFPVTLTIKDSEVTNYHTDDRTVLEFLDKCFKEKFSRQVGELGFGTNRKILKPLAMNCHINERKPGVHLGLGQHNQSAKIVNYQCSLHLDLIADGGSIWIDESTTSIDLKSFPPTHVEHPQLFQDEDVFSPEAEMTDGDCCGLVRQGEMSIFTIT